MMKIVLACSVLLALSYSVSSETIDCYFCGQSEIQKKIFKPRDLVDLPTELCAVPIENSTTITVDGEKDSCATLDVEVINLSIRYSRVILRVAIEKDTCPEIEQELQDELESEGLESSVKCSQCSGNLCNGR